MSENDNIKTEQEIDLNRLLGSLFRNLHWLALVAVICGLAAWFYSSFVMKPMYTSSSTIYTHNAALYTPDSNRQTVTYNELYAAEQLAGPYTKILTSDSLLNKTIRSLHLTDVTADSLRRGLSVKKDDSLVFTVSLTRDDPVEAQRILSRLLRFYPQEIDRVVHSGGSEVIDEATLPTRPSSPNVMRNTVIGAFAGFLLAAAFCVLYSRVNEVVTDEESLVRDFGLPVLSAIPQIEKPGKDMRKHEKE